MTRSEYVLDLPDTLPVGPLRAGVELRPPEHGDAEALAQLMLDAYRGTIDYEGETIVEAREEIAGYFGGEANLEASRLAWQDGSLVAACLVTTHSTGALIGYVMTAAEHKNTRLATTALAHTLRALADAGHGSVRAWITDGNVPSERLFVSAGFTRLTGT